MKRRGRRLIAGFLLLSALAAGGCGGIVVHEDLNDREETSVIRIAWWGGEERHAVTGQVLSLYTQLFPEVEFETFTYTWEDYFDALSLEAAQGDMPDLIQMDYQYITTYSENGSLADLTCFVEDGTIRTESMDKELLQSGVVRGRLSGIPLGTSVISIICNSEVFDEAGIPIPGADWTWKDFADICVQIRENTGKYGAAMTPVLDLNLYHCWVRQHGEELFSPDCRSLGYGDDTIYVGYVSLFKKLIDVGAVPDSDTWAAITVRGQERLPVVTGEGGMMQEWNNFPVKLNYVNDTLRLVTPPLSDSGVSGLWMKPSMFFSIAETSKVKEECARFLDWFLNSSEANELLKGERGVPISGKIRDSLMECSVLSETQREMFRFSDMVEELCGELPPPEPAGIEGINEAFIQTANAYFYGALTAEEAAAEFRYRTDGILTE